MYNLIVLGCGRSGTSMVTGTLATGGYSTGDDNWPPDENNPNGYYEERGILELNAQILASQTPSPVKRRAPNHRHVVVYEGCDVGGSDPNEYSEWGKERIRRLVAKNSFFSPFAVLVWIGTDERMEPSSKNNQL